MAKISYQSRGFSQLSSKFEAFLAEAQNAVVQERNRLIEVLSKLILAATPVWEGDTIVNYRWSIGAPSYAHIEPMGQEMEPGATNKMPLGAEPRRSMNEAVVLSSVAAILQYKGLADVYLTNPSEGAIPLEYGFWPGGKGQVDRTHGRGIVRLALKDVVGHLRA